MQQLTLTQPDDWHCHLREGAYLRNTVPDVARTFARAIVMPNLKDPITDEKKAAHYYQQIQNHIPPESHFKPLMTLYLNDHTQTATLEAAKASPFIYALKLYPAGITTGAQAGVRNIKALYPLFQVMSELDLPLLVHGESRAPQIDVFDRETHFIDTELQDLCTHCPNLRIVLEHITTQKAVDFVSQASTKLAATITPHHLLYDRNDLLGNGLRPHLFCLPILKRANDQQALIKAATSGNPKFFLGTDSAPHPISEKESACGCAGIYSAPYALALYAQVFENENALDRLEDFASHFGADFYGVARNSKQITLQKHPQTLPLRQAFGNQQVIPIAAGQTLPWTVVL